MTDVTEADEVVTPPIAERLSGAGKGLLALALLGGWLVLMRGQGWVDQSGGGIFSLGFLLVAGTVGGKVAAIFKLPRLTGYLAVGVLSGPYVLELFSKADVRSLTLINTLALALIALQAGAELTIPMLKRSMRSLSWATVTHSLIIALGMTALFAILAPSLEFMRGYGVWAILAVGSVWGAMAVSKAPADTLAILGETRAKGPLAEHALGVVVLLDVVVLVLFAVALMFARAATDPAASLSVAVLEHLGLELVASVAAGTTFGLLIAFYFWAIGREKLLFTVAAAYGITAFCAYFHYDTLLVFVVAGFVVMNLTREGHALVETTESAAAAVMVVFFATAGAQLDVGALAVFGPIAAALAFGRIGFTWLACQLGHRLARDPPSVKKYAWTSFISQAGVTIGLGTIAAESLGDVGAGISTLIIAVIGINELIGPVAFKLGLAQGAKLEASLASTEPGDDEASAVAEAPTPKPASHAEVHAALRKQLAQAIHDLGDDVESEIKEEGTQPILEMLLGGGRGDVEGKVRLHGDGEHIHLDFSGRLPGRLPYGFKLKSKKGLRGLAIGAGQAKTGDAEIDENFVVDADRNAHGIVKRLAPSLLRLAGYPVTLDAEAGGLKVHLRDVARDGEDLRAVLAMTVDLWREIYGEATERRP